MKLTFIDDRIRRMETPVKLKVSKYPDGSWAIFLAFAENDLLWASATVFRGPVKDKETAYIRDDEDNVGMVDLLIKNGIIHDSFAVGGDRNTPLCRLTEEFIQYAKAISHENKSDAEMGLPASSP